MAIEIVDFSIKNGDVPVRYVKLPEGTCSFHTSISELGLFSTTHCGNIGTCFNNATCYSSDHQGIPKKSHFSTPFPWIYMGLSENRVYSQL